MTPTTTSIRIATPRHRSRARLTALGGAMIAAMILSLVSGLALVPPQPSAARSLQSSPDQMIATLDGVESAYARRYGSADGLHNHAAEATPSASPAETDPAMTDAAITIIQFATEADAEQAWKLTSGTLVAGAIIGEDPADLTATEMADLGDEATIYLMPDATGSETEADGILFVRDGTTGIIVQGRGDTSNAALGERLQAFAGFVLDHPASSDPVAVVHEGVATGGDFARMPGPGDADVLQGLVPLWDYDLMVDDSPILPPDATPDDCACSQQDFPPPPTPTPIPPCGCTPPTHG